MPDDSERARVAPADRGDLSGQDRYEMDAGARDAMEDLSPEEQEAMLTQMRRHIEHGLSDDEAWQRAFDEVRRHDVSVAREGEEGAVRGKHPVEAHKRTTYAEPGTVEADRDRVSDRK